MGVRSLMGHKSHNPQVCHLAVVAILKYIVKVETITVLN